MLQIHHAILLALSGASVSVTAHPTPVMALAGSQQVEIVLANFSFTPSEIRLTAGTPVTLHLVNRGSGGHNFMAKEFFAAASMDAATRATLGKKGVVELAKDESIDITMIPKAGSYKVKCGHFLHSGFGMKGTITVS